MRWFRLSYLAARLQHAGALLHCLCMTQGTSQPRAILLHTVHKAVHVWIHLHDCTTEGQIVCHFYHRCVDLTRARIRSHTLLISCSQQQGESRTESLHQDMAAGFSAALRLTAAQYIALQPSADNVIFHSGQTIQSIVEPPYLTLVAL